MHHSETKSAASCFTGTSVYSVTSQVSENDPVDRNIYMFGDVSRLLILDGIKESLSTE